MNTETEICAVCAWRATCQKKFSISGKDFRCTDFVKDISLKETEENREIKGETKNGKFEKKV